MELTDQQLDQIEARANAATRPPWRWDAPYDLVGTDGDPDVYEYETSVLSIDHDGGCGCRSVCHLDIEISDTDAEFIANARADIAALIADVRGHRNTIARVQALADAWTARGEHGMAYSKTIPDENIADYLLGAGAEMVENARHIRNALTEETPDA